MSTPYYSDESCELWLGDCREILPLLDVTPDSCCTDPPYGETSAAWDRWPDGWVDAVGAVLPESASLWCFGSARMFLLHRDDFAGWKYAQEALWLKRNGSGPTSRDRLVKIHEWAYHWYRGRWSDLHHEWTREPYTGPNKTSGRRRVDHQGWYGSATYTDDRTRQPCSVSYLIEAPSVKNQKRHQDEKPTAAVLPLVRECTPPGGLVLDCFAGSGTTGVVAQLLGVRSLLIEADEATCEKAAIRLGGRQDSLLDLIGGDVA